MHRKCIEVIRRSYRTGLSDVRDASELRFHILRLEKSGLIFSPYFNTQPHFFEYVNIFKNRIDDKNVEK